MELDDATSRKGTVVCDAETIPCSQRRGLGSERPQQAASAARWLVVVFAQVTGWILRRHEPARPLNASGMNTRRHPLNKAHFSQVKCSAVKIAQWASPRWVNTPRWAQCNRLEPLHFSGMAFDAGFNDHGHVVVGFQGPNAQRHPQLAVVAQWAWCMARQVVWQTGQPFFDGGFPVASCDRQDGPGKASR